MNNLFDKIGNDLKNYSPEAPAYMEERIQKAVMSQKSKVRFWFSLNAILLFVGVAAAGVFSTYMFKTPAPAMAMASPVEAQQTRVVQTPVAEVQSTASIDAPKSAASTKRKSSGNLSVTSTITTPVIIENCGGAPEEVVKATEQVAQVDSSVKVIQSQEVPVKKRRSLPVTRLHIQK